MRLDHWLDETDTTQADLAARVGLTQGRISQIIREGTNSILTARRISEATGGQVPVDELLPPAEAAQ